MLGVLLLLALWAPVLRAFPDGAPAEACIRNMQPNHSGATGRSLLDSPYAVLRQTSPGRVTVTVKPTHDGSYIKGFMIQARDPLTGEAARHQGAWLPVENVKGLPECAAVTHADRGQKAQVAVTWEGRTDIAFYATIVSSYSSFWVNIEAAETGDPSGFSGPGTQLSSFSGPGTQLSSFSGPGTQLRGPSALSVGPSGLGSSFHPFAGKKK